MAPDIALLRPAGEEPALREYVGVLVRRKRAIAVFVLLVVAMAVGSSLVQAETYTAEARVLIQPRDSSEELASGAAPIVVDRKRIIDTEVRVMASESVRRRVEAIFGEGTPGVSVLPVEGTDLVAISVSSTDPALAQAVANTTAREYAAYRRDTRKDDLTGGVASLQAEMASLTTQIDDLQGRIGAATGAEAARLKVQQSSALARFAQLEQQADSLALSASLSTGDANLIDPAKLPGSPSSPKPIRALILALVAGTVLGVGLAFLLDLLDDRIESKDDVERILPGRPVLGLVPTNDRWGSGTHVAALEEPDGALAEAYRSLRTSLQFLVSEREYRTIQVTSAVSGEGKSTTAVNLAVMFALAGAETVLVDADLRQPTVHRFLDVPNREGLSSGLLDKGKTGRLLAKVDAVPDLYVLTSGPIPALPAELLQSERTQLLIDMLGKEADIVIIDSPPILPVADPLALAGKVDAVLLVTSVAGTTRRQLGRAVELLDQVGGNLAGTVINKVPAGDAAAYGSYAYRVDAARGRVDRFLRPASV